MKHLFRSTNTTNAVQSIHHGSQPNRPIPRDPQKPPLSQTPKNINFGQLRNFLRKSHEFLHLQKIPFGKEKIRSFYPMGSRDILSNKHSPIQSIVNQRAFRRVLIWPSNSEWYFGSITDKYSRLFLLREKQEIDSLWHQIGDFL